MITQMAGSTITKVTIASCQPRIKKNKIKFKIFKVEFLLNPYGFDCHEVEKLSHPIVG